MSEPLARMERPAVDSFSGHRKLFVVFLVYSHESAPAEYNQRCERYWQQADEQLLKLETKIGAAKHVYHEAVYETGDAGLLRVESMNEYSHRLISRRCAEGAVLEALEEQELAAELNDWERFVMFGFASKKVADLVSDLYSQASKKRNEHAVQVIDSTLGEGESGVLFVREGHRLQFPTDIEVFSVVPPALDEMHRWLRDQAQVSEASGVEEAGEEEESAPPAGEQKS